MKAIDPIGLLVVTICALILLLFFFFFFSIPQSIFHSWKALLRFFPPSTKGWNSTPSLGKGMTQYNECCVTYFLIDGFAKETFDKLLAEGKLKTMQRLMEQGVFIENGITSFPSVTGFAYYPFITGCDATKSGLLGLRWFNRDDSENRGGERNYLGRTTYALNEDMVKHTKTVFELIGNQRSYSSQSYTNRGVTKHQLFGWPLITAKFAPFWPFSWFAWTPGGLFLANMYDWIEYEKKILRCAIEELSNNPKVQWITFASPDSYVHIHGIDKGYEVLCSHVDSFIGEYIRHCEEHGLDQKRIICVISDHGEESVSTNVDIAAMLNHKFKQLTYLNLNKTNITSARLSNSLIGYEKFNVIAAVNGNLMLYLYFRSQISKDWRQPLSYEELSHYNVGSGYINLMEEVIQLEGVEFAISKGEEQNTVEIFSPQGVGRIAKDSEGSLTYSVKQGLDPLQYPLHLHQCPMTEREWLEHTYFLEYPYAPVRLYNLLHTHHATPGDIVVTSKRNCDFGVDCEPFVKCYRGGHGGLRRAQMVVPAILKGPGIAPIGTLLPTATTEDIGATVLNLMGINTEGEGHPLF